MATKKGDGLKKKSRSRNKELHEAPGIPTVVELWEKQDDEHDAAFAAFKFHLDSGIERSASKTARAMNQKRSAIERWSWEWSWKKRITAWDRHEWKHIRRARLDEILAMRDRHAKIARSMLGKVAERLASEVAEKMIDASSLTAPQLAQWVDVAAKLERLSLGEPTELSGHVETEETTPSTEIFRDPEVRRGLDQAAARIARLARDSGSDGGET